MADVTTGEKRAHILVAEDIPMNQALISAQLEKGGYSFEITSNGREAVDAVRNGTYDLILMDIQMPEVSGIEATTIIREDMGISAIELPIIALTAHALPDEIKACLECGMDECLVKPVDAQKLYKTIDSVLGMDLTDPFLNAPCLANDSRPNPLLDAQQINQFENFIGYERLCSLFEDFINEAERGLSALEENGHIPYHDLHTLTGVAGNFGLSRLAQYCRTILDHQTTPNADISPPIDVIHILLGLFHESIAAVENRALPTLAATS